MVKKRQRYPKEFKLEAVQLGLESEKSLAEVARDLGIAPALLHSWKKALEQRAPDAAFPGHGKAAGPEDELRRLRRKLAQVEQERAFCCQWALNFSTTPLRHGSPGGINHGSTPWGRHKRINIPMPRGWVGRRLRAQSPLNASIGSTLDARRAGR